MTTKFIPTEEQAKILSLEKGTHLVLAPPGSGKTELLANRVMKAKESGFDDTEIICLTFTNRAAKGMQARIETAYPENEFIIGNIHYFCLMFLMKNNLLPINTEALDEEETIQLIEEIKNELRYDDKVQPNMLLLLATYIKQKALGFPESLIPKLKIQSFPDPWKAKVVSDAYIKEKEQNKYFDFDDLLTLAYHHLSNDKNKELKLSNFKWLQIDEVQDLNPLQWAIIHEITSKDALSVYFGDYDQAIFSFMGAELDSLSKIKKTVNTNNQNEIHFLSKNFRAPSYLLDVYTKYAQSNWSPTWETFPTPTVIKSTPKHALVMIKVNGSKEKEFQLITNKIIPSLTGNDETTAIIVRYNGSADTIGQYLKEQQISFFQVSGFDLFRKKKVKALMAFFSTFLNSNDRIAWTRLFFEYNIFTTLKESRNFINQLFRSGLTPVDILEYKGESSGLIDFFDVFSTQEMIVFDTETTGLNIEQDDIIQIAAVRIKNGKIAEVFEVFMNTEKDVTETEKVHKISKDYLNEHGVSNEQGLMDFMNFCGENAVLVAHNIEYDYGIVHHNLQRFCNVSLADYSQQQFDTIDIAKSIHPDFTSYKLEYLIEKLGAEGVNSHNALDDVKATVSVIEQLNIGFLSHQYETQKEYLSNPENTKVIERFINRFAPLYTDIKSKLEEQFTLKQVADYYYTYYKNLFPQKGADEQKWKEEMKELDKLFKHFEHTTKNNRDLNLSQLIKKHIPDYKLYKETDLYLGNEEVVVSTIHKAKGLEFDNVIVAEVVDGTYPSFHSKTTEEIHEDARALYVAMTRAKKRLYFTSHTTFRGYKKTPSRFLEGIKGLFREVER